MKNLRIRFALLLVLLSLISLAIAGEYDSNKRFSELKEEAEKTAGLKPNELEELIKTYSEYNKARNEGFSSILENLRAKDVALRVPKYNENINTLLKKTEDRDSDMRKLPESAYKLYLSFKNKEIEYLNAMKDLKIGTSRDSLVYLNANLEDYTKNLKIKWDNLLNQDQNYDEQEKKISDEIQEIFRKVAQDVAGSRTTSQEKIKKFTESMIKASVGSAVQISSAVLQLFADFMKEQTDIEDKTIGRLLNNKEEVRTRAATLRNYYDIEKRGIFVLFDGTYFDTKKFINDNALNAAKPVFEQAIKDTETLASIGTSGQKDDGKKLGEAAASIFNDHFNTIKATFNKFVLENEGIFFGPVGPKLKDALLETKTWQDENNETQQINLEGLLRSYREGLKGDYEPIFVNISGLSSTDRSLIEDRLKTIMTKIRDAIKQSEDEMSNNNMQQLLLEERKAMEKDLENGKN